MHFSDLCHKRGLQMKKRAVISQSIFYYIGYNGSRNWLAEILCHIQNLERFLVVINGGIVTFMTSDS